MSSDPTQTTSQIQDELLNEVKQELERRGTSMLLAKPRPEDDTLGALAVSAILACLALLAGSGVVMALVYTPTVEDANASTAWFQAGALGSVVRACHYHAASLLVLLSAAYLAYLAWRGLFRRPAQWRWWRGMLVLLLALAFFGTGQLLPFDQLAVHGTHIRLGYLAEAPVIGETLRALIQGGDSIGTATLSRFFGMHAIVLPALTLIVLRWLWRDAGADIPIGYTLGVCAAVVGPVVGASLLFSAPLGLQGNLAEPYPSARPEWFGTPLYAVLKLAPPGPAHMLILFVAPLVVLALMTALPYIETAADGNARLRKPLQIGLIAMVAFLLIFSAVPLFQDMSAREGWFARQSPEEIMAAIGPRNTALRNTSEEVPEDAHNLARDLALLHDRLVGNYPDDMEDSGREEWDRLARAGAAAARSLLLAGDEAAQMKAREDMRSACLDCHKLHEKEDVPLDPPPRYGAGPARQEKKLFFDQEKLGMLNPSGQADPHSTSRMMDQMKWSLRDILIAGGVIAESRDTTQPLRGPEQALVDLRHVTNIVAGHYERNGGAYYSEAKWDNWIKELREATSQLALAKDPADLARKAAAVGKACENCHDGADEPDKPIEWSFKSFLPK